MRRYLLLLFALSTLIISWHNPEIDNSSESWSSEVWRKCTPIYDKIIQHPFVLELADGSLTSERFSRYLAQDIIYCSNYYKTLAQFGELLEDQKEITFFAPYTNPSEPSESGMQQSLIEKFGIQPATPSFVTLSYNAHEQTAVDTGSKEIAIAALLPCLWIYEEVGSYILSIAKLDDNPYKEWILEYSNDEYVAWIKELLIIIDSWAEASDETTKAKMTEVFLESAQFEYDFWDYGYNGE